FDDEVLMRVEYVPGGHQELPAKVTGAAAAKLPAGKVWASHDARFIKGRRVTIQLVALDTHFALDQLINGRRVARIDVPEFRPAKGGEITDFEVYHEERPQEIGIYIEYINEESQRVLSHFYSSFPYDFEFVN